MIFWGSPRIFVKTRLASWDEPLTLENQATMFVRLHRIVHSQLFKYSMIPNF